MLSRETIDRISSVLQAEQIVFSDLVCAYVQGTTNFIPFTGSTYAVHAEICSTVALTKVLSCLINTPATSSTITRVARNLTLRSCVSELSDVVSPSKGFHFNVGHATPEQFHQFSSIKMAKTFENTCPTVWKLFGVLLNATTAKKLAESANKRGDYWMDITYQEVELEDSADITSRQSQTASEDLADMPEEDWGNELIEEDWGDVDTASVEVPGQGADEAKSGTLNVATDASYKNRRKRGLRRQIERTKLRIIAMFNICMNNSNMRCNALQALIGLFMHSSNVPEKVVELLAHMGLSVTPSSMNRMIEHMSKEAEKTLKKQLPTLLVGLGYDNLEIWFDTEQPTATNPGKLVSLTTATCIPLRPGATKEHLRVSKELWARSRFNLDRSKPPILPSHRKLMGLMAKSACPPDDPQSVESLFAWHVRQMLLNDNVETIPSELKELFRRECLGLPEFRKRITHAKTTQRPMRSMNISVSSTSGNAAAIENMLEQGGVKTEDLEEHAVLMHGDLGTGEKLDSLQESRAIEKTARDRLQSLVFIIRWFHTRMAMIDSLWRLWILPERTRPGHITHPLSILQLCAILRPRDMGKITTNPGFRMAHSLIEHLTLALVADAWRLLVEAEYHVALSEWKPTWEQVLEMSRKVVRGFVAPQMYRPTTHKDTTDNVQDQMRLFLRNSLHYLAITQASRYGDVGRMEELLPEWVYIWKQTGKHKYAAHYSRFLVNLDEGWPSEFAEVVRQNWLVNPTGKIDGFRGADWLVERSNYLTKCLYSGSGSNRTLQNLIKQSVLIDILQAMYGIIDKNFYLTGKTVWHPPPIVRTGLAMVRRYIENEAMNSHKPGRKLSSTPTNAYAAAVNSALKKLEEFWEADQGEEDADETEDGEGRTEDGGISAEDLGVDE
ncbi:hypothetical protein FRC12_008256 [Ceratobasidium sp. 428]|nr:hypothetical protein FRC12_008256 [Ceratobasidium sp. 428]